MCGIAGATRRGLQCFVLNAHTLEVVRAASFDTYGTAGDRTLFNAFVASIPHDYGYLVVVGVRDRVQSSSPTAVRPLLLCFVPCCASTVGCVWVFSGPS